MIKVLSLAGFFALASGVTFGDSILLGSNQSLVNVWGLGGMCGSLTGAASNAPSQCGALGTGPYWDNDSTDGVRQNIGYFLGGSVSQYLSQNNGAGNPDAPSIITLVHSSNAASVLLEDVTGDGTLSFGFYNTSSMAMTSIYGTLIPNDPSAYSPVILPLTSGENYGFYLTRACYTNCPVGDTTPGYITLFSNPSLNTCTVYETSSQCANDQHFTIFTSPTAGIYYVGIEDWGSLGGSSNGEGIGDFNDVVFELNTSTSAIPEPASFGLIGAGLLGLGFARLRARKGRA
jgi:hypothetical protein